MRRFIIVRLVLPETEVHYDRGFAPFLQMDLRVLLLLIAYLIRCHDLLLFRLLSVKRHYDADVFSPAGEKTLDNYDVVC